MGVGDPGDIDVGDIDVDADGGVDADADVDADLRGLGGDPAGTTDGGGGELGPGETGIPGAPGGGVDGGGTDGGGTPGPTGPGPGETGIPGAPDETKTETEVGTGGGGRAGGVTSEEAERAGTAAAVEETSGGGGRAGGVTSGEAEAAGEAGQEQAIDREQGLETANPDEVFKESAPGQQGRVTGESARELEERVLRNNPNLTEEDVRVTVTPAGPQVELTPTGQAKRAVDVSSPAGGFRAVRGGTPTGALPPLLAPQSAPSRPAGGAAGIRGGESLTPSVGAARTASRPELGFESIRGGTPAGEAAEPAVQPRDVSDLSFGERVLAFGSEGTPEDIFAREALTTGIGLTFSGPLSERLARGAGLRGERLERVRRTDITGPEIGTRGIEESPPGELDEEIAGFLTTGGFLAEDEPTRTGIFLPASRRQRPIGPGPVPVEQPPAGGATATEFILPSERELAEASQEARERFSISDELRELGESAGLPEPALNLLGGKKGEGGVGALPGEVGALRFTGPLLAESAVEVVSRTPEATQRFGAGETAETIVEGTGRLTQGIIESAEEDPAGFTGEVGAEIGLGIGASRAATRGFDIGRAKLREARGPVVDLEEVRRGETPERFETGPFAPTRQAVEEVRERAADQPAALQNFGEFTVPQAVAFRARQQVGTPLARARELATVPFERARSAGVAGLEAGRGRLAGAAPDVDLAGGRVTAGASAIGQAGRAGAARARAAGEAPFTAAERAGFAAGVRVGEGIGAAEALIDRPISRAEDIAFRAGVRTGEGIGRAEDVLDRPFQAAEAAGFAAGVRVGEGIGAAESRLASIEERIVGPVARPFEERAFQLGERAGAFAAAAEAERPSGESLPGALLFRSESEPLTGSLTVEGGEFELPGLFAAPDLSTLRLQTGETTSFLPSLRFGLPRVRGRGDQVTLFPGERIEAMPESATGFGFAVETPEGELITGLGAGEGRILEEITGGQRVPDPTTSGAQFLEEQAERGTAFVRPTRSRTPELEAIFPPESEFVQVGEFGVRLESGRVVPGAAFARVEGQEIVAGGVELVGEGTERLSAEEVPVTIIRSRGTGQPEDIVVPPTPIPRVSTGQPETTVSGATVMTQTDEPFAITGLSGITGVSESLFGGGGESGFLTGLSEGVSSSLSDVSATETRATATRPDRPAPTTAPSGPTSPTDRPTPIPTEPFIPSVPPTTSRGGGGVGGDATFGFVPPPVTAGEGPLQTVTTGAFDEQPRSRPDKFDIGLVETQFAPAVGGVDELVLGVDLIEGDDPGERGFMPQESFVQPLSGTQVSTVITGLTTEGEPFSFRRIPPDGVELVEGLEAETEGSTPAFDFDIL